MKVFNFIKIFLGFTALELKINLVDNLMRGYSRG